MSSIQHFVLKNHLEEFMSWILKLKMQVG